MRVRLNNDSIVGALIFFSFFLFNATLLGSPYDLGKPVGGVISTTNNTEQCIGNGANDIINVELSGNVGDSSVYVLTSGVGVIKELSFDPTFNLAGADPGTYKIIHISYDEFTIGPRIGINIKKLKGWFDLSNELIINRIFPYGGYLRSSFDSESELCISDGEIEIIEVLVSGAEGDYAGWVVADVSGNIIRVSATNLFNFENEEPGVVFIYHYAGFGDVPPILPGQNINSISSCIHFSNGFKVDKVSNCTPVCDVQAGQIILVNPTDPNNTNSISVCVDDNEADIVRISENRPVENPDRITRYILTAASGQILDISSQPSFNINHSSPVICFVNQINYYEGIQNLAIGNLISQLDGCFALSNSLQIIKETDCGPDPCNVNAGLIQFVQNPNNNTARICVDDGINDNLQLEVNGNVGPSTWAVTDQNGIILLIQNDPVFNFEGSSISSCIIRHISLQDPITGFGVGQNIEDIQGCIELSNSLVVIKEQNCGVQACTVNGGIISENGQTEFTICVDDGVADFITPTVTNNTGMPNWVITDMNGNILMVTRNNSFNFEGSGQGVCQLWHVSTDETEQGLDSGVNISEVVGCFDLSNPITITRNINCGQPVCDVDGGSIISTDNQTNITICTDDDIDDTFQVNLTQNSGSSIWLVTDTNGTLLSIQNSNVFMLDDVAVGVCRVYHMSLTDPITGFGIGRNLADIDGCFDLSNPINITKESNCGVPVCSVVGGAIASNGATDIKTCVDDGLQDNIVVDLSASSGSSIFLVTDLNGIILLIQNSNNFNFEGTSIGACQIWHMSFTDPLTGFGVGQNVSNIDGCFDLSNPINVSKERNCGVPVCSVVGGTISSNGVTDISICVDDDLDDNIVVDLSGNSGSSIFLVTDLNGIILRIQNSNIFNFEGNSIGACQIWHMSLTDPLTGFGVGQNVSNIDGCFDLSNPINVTKETNCGVPVCNVASGTIASNGATDINPCVDDELDDNIVVDLNGNSGSSIFLVTDLNGIILLIQNSNNFNFEGTSIGACQIWHMSFTDPLTGSGVGQNLTNLAGCFDLSNPINVTKERDCGVPDCNVNAGSISVNGLTTVSICLSDDSAKNLSVTLTGNSGSSIFLITDDAGIILDIQNTPNFEFSGATAGVCRIWHMSLQDPITGFAVGQNVSNIQGCFQLSNSIIVNKEVDCGQPVCDVNGGNISTNGLTSVSVCLSDDQPDIINAGLAGNTGSSSWLVTDENGLILLIQNNPSFNFTDVQSGVCLIWHISFQDPLTGFSVGQNVSQITGCFDFSNSISVTRTVDCGQPACDVSSGNINTNGATSIEICLSDADSDVVPVTLSGNTGSSTWLVTDEDGNIMSIQNDPNFDFSAAGEGVCYIWHMSLQDPITGFAIGQNVSQISGCFEISNSIAVTRIVDCGPPSCNVSSGNINTNGATSIEICLSDADSDVVPVTLSGNTGSSTWLVTDEDGNIMSIQNDPNFDFSEAGEGICYIWHMSLQDPITGFAIGQNVSQISGCFEISNSIAVTRIVDCGPPSCDVSSGNINTNGATSIEICLSDADSDVVPVTLSGNTGSSTWLVTDEDGNIMSIQNDPNFDFSAAGEGICYIWHMSLQDPITGFAIGQNVSQISGCFAISNSIAVTRISDCGPPPCNIDAGSIALADNNVSITYCTSDGVSDVPDIVLSNNIGSSIWLLTETDGTIIAIENNSNINFEGVEAGVCYIYHMSLEDPVSGFAVGANISDLGGCFDLSNFVQVIRETECGPPPCDGIVGGNITTIDNQTSLTVCVDDRVAEGIEIVLAGNNGSSTWVVTDTNGNILNIQNNNIFSFEGVEAGVCFIYHLSLDDNIEGFTVGEPLSNISGCFSLSNRIQVIREVNCGPETCVAQGGSIVAADGSTSVIYCVDDGVSDVLDIELTGNVGATTWFLTDGSGNIVDINSSPSFNFEGAPEGICFIYHMSLQDPVTGFTADGNISDIEGCFSLSNAISVERVTGCGPNTCAVDGGIIMTSDSLTTISVCVTDGQNENIQVIVDNFEGARLWVVTNNVGVIQSIQATDVFNFEGVAGGTCFIYNITIKDPVSGFEVGQVVTNIQGCYDLSNPITVNRLEDCTTEPMVAGGNITGPGNTTSFSFCADDGLPDMVTITLNDQLGESTWIATDTAGLILSVQGSPTFNFEGAGAGLCQIWHVSSVGPLQGLTAGQNINQVTGTFALSNAIFVMREVGCGPIPCDATGGQIVTINNQLSVSICVEDDVPDVIEALLSGNSGDSQWVLTSSAGNILSIQSDRSFDFSNSPAGTCFIWHLSSLDSLTNFNVGQNINNVSGCFDLSNSIEVIKQTGCQPLTCDDIRSGTITVMGGQSMVTVCVDDSMNEDLVPEIEGNVGGSIWVVTDNNDRILSVENDAIFNFEGNPTGTCFIRHIGVLDPITGLIPGNNLSDISGCIQISNSITVIRELCSTEPCGVSGGAISTSDSFTSITLCVDDNVSDMFAAVLSNNTGFGQWIITDSLGFIVGVQAGDNPNFDFESSGAGMCQVWHLSTRDSTFNVAVGQNVSTFEGCFSLSNAITVTRLAGDCAMTTCDDILVGSISLADGSTSDTVCIDDGLNESLTISLTGNTGAGIFIITDSNGTILDLENSSTFNFEGIPEGVCLIQHASLLEPFEGLIPGENVTGITGCVKLSNTVSITRISCAEPVCEVDGGSIVTSSGVVELSLCVDDNVADVIDFNVTGSNGFGTWLITDSAGNIIDVFDGSRDFEGADEGRCLIWHLASRDSTFTVTNGQNANDLTGCFDLSNSIILERNINCAMDSCMVIGGTIATSDGQTELTICADDGLSDAFDVVVTGAVGNNSLYIVADTSGQILGAQLESSIDLEGAGGGTCLVYHASLRDSISGAVLGLDINNIEACISLSNPITVIRNEGCDQALCELLAPTISLANGGGTETTVCTDDTLDENIDVTLLAGNGDSSIWIITDTAGVIIDIPMGPPFNFEGVTPGICLIWNATFTDTLGSLAVGMNASNIQGCLALSNPISISRINNCTNENCEAIASTIALSDNTVSATVCTDDNLNDSIAVSASGGNGDSSIWLVTDTLGIILEIPAGPPFNFEGIDPGVCLIWNVLYDGTIAGIAVGSDAANIDGCFALSNSIRITRENNCTVGGCNASAAVINTEDGTSMVSVCVDDGIDEAVITTLVPGTGDTSIWIVTDTSGVILDLPAGPPFNFEGLAPGICLIWNLNATGSITGLSIDSLASNIEGCAVLSNPIQVTREIECDPNACLANGGILSTDSGETSITVCSGDGFEDELFINLDGVVGAGDLLLVVDSQRNIRNLVVADTDTFDFEGVEAGVFSVFHLAFIGEIGMVIEMGSVDSITGCFDLSNPIEVTVETDCTDCPSQGGTIMLPDSTQLTTVCVGGGDQILIEPILTGASGESSFWVVTDTSGLILNTQDNGIFDFEAAGPGVSQIWHISFDGTITNFVLGQNLSNILGCFDLSNPIEVFRNFVDGGMISTDSLDTELTICVGDSIRDVLTFINTSTSNLNYTYLITDVNNRFLATNISGSIDIENIGVGMCRIYGVSHVGNPNEVFTIQSQQDVTTTPIADCYELSQNFIQLNRVSGDDCPDGSFTSDEDISFITLGNPVTDEFVLQIESQNVEGEAFIELLDINGQIVMSEKVDLVIGDMRKSLDVSHLPAGFYYATVRNNYYILANQRIIVQR